MNPGMMAVNRAGAYPGHRLGSMGSQEGGDQVCKQTGQDGCTRSHEHSNVLDVDGWVEEGEDMIQGARQHHQSRIRCLPRGPSLRIPNGVVNP